MTGSTGAAWHGAAHLSARCRTAAAGHQRRASTTSRAPAPAAGRADRDPRACAAGARPAASWRANAERHLKPPHEMARLFRDYPGAIAETGRFFAESALLARRAALRISRRGAAASAPRRRRSWSAWPGRAPAGAIRSGVPDKVTTRIDHELALIGRARLRALFPHRPRHRPLRPRRRASSARGAARRPIPPSASASASPRSIPAADRPPLRALHLAGAARAARHRRRFRARAARGGDPVHLRANTAATAPAWPPPSSPTARARRAREVGKVFGLSDDAVAALSGLDLGLVVRRSRRARGRRPPASTRPGRAPPPTCCGFPPSSSAFRATCPSMSAASSSPATGSTSSCRSPMPAMEGRTIVEWDKDDLDALGILKIDVLALGMLTCLRRGLRPAGAHYGRDADAGDDPRSERPARLRHDPARRHDRRLPDREPGADVDAAAAQARRFLRSRHRGGDRPARPDPGRHGPSLSAPPAGQGGGHLSQGGTARACSARRSACRCSRSRR